MKTGAQWEYIHKDYGNSRALHKRYKYWADKGIWNNLMTYVSDVDSQQFRIDSLSVKAHACASGYEINGNKIHALGRSIEKLLQYADTAMHSAKSQGKNTFAMYNVNFKPPAKC